MLALLYLAGRGRFAFSLLFFINKLMRQKTKKMDIISKQPSFIPKEGIKSRGISIYGEGSKFKFLRERKIILSFVAVIIALLFWAGIKGYEFYLKSKIDSIDRELAVLNGKNENIKIAKKLKDTENAQNIINNLFVKHIYSSKFLDIIDKNTNPQILWSSVNLNTIDGRANLTGSAPSFAAQDEQVGRFIKAGFQVTYTPNTESNFSVKLQLIDKNSLLASSTDKFLKCVD